MTEPEPTRAGFVAIIGAPNVGKSTLLNRLVGTKVSIVSPKVQTTRRRVIGITLVGQAQVMFVDTPGIFAPKRRLETAMVKAASAGIADADLVLLVLDAKKGLDGNGQLALRQLAREKRRAFLVVNKIDSTAAGACPAADRRRQRGLRLRRHLHRLRAQRRRLRGPAGRCGARAAGGPLAVPRRPALGSLRSGARRRDHPRADLPPTAPGAALQHHGRDRGLGRVAGRQRGADRPDHLRPARQPKAHPDRQEGPAAQGAGRGVAARARADPGASASTCSCSSRCARTGSTTPSATARWASISSGDRRCHGLGVPDPLRKVGRTPSAG